MDDKKEKSLKEIQSSVENLLDTKTVLKIKTPTKEEKEYEVFESIIYGMEGLNERSKILSQDLDLNLTMYEKGFYYIIDDLFKLQYGEDASKLIYFYLYDRIGEDGSIKQLMNEKENKPIPLNDTLDLWNLVQILKKKKNKFKI